MLNISQYNGINLTQKTHKQETKKAQNTNYSSSQRDLVSISLDHLKANFLSFKGSQMDNKLDVSEVSSFVGAFDEEADKIWEKAIEAATKSNSAELNSLHVLKAILEEAKGTTNKLKHPVNIELCNRLSSPITITDELIDSFVFEIDRMLSNLPQNTDGSKGPKKVSTELVNVLIKADRLGYETPTSGMTVNYMHIKMPNLCNAIIKADPASNPGALFFENGLKGIQLVNSPEFSDSIIDFAGVDTNNLIDLKYYNLKAEQAALAVSTDKNAIITYDQGTMPELVAQSFVKKVKSGNSLIFDKDTTIQYIKTSQMYKGATSNNKQNEGEKSAPDTVDYLIDLENQAQQALNEAAQTGKPAKEFVIFIEDMDQLIMDLDQRSKMKSRQYDPASFFSSDVYKKNLHIVGMMSNPVYKSLHSTSMNGVPNTEKVRLSEALTKQFEPINLGTLSPKMSAKYIKNRATTFIKYI